MARIVITGGAGFIGSHLTDTLVASGHEVTVLDNLFTGRKSNLVQHWNNPKFEFVRHDVIESVLLEAEQVYHLACPASPVHYQHNPVKTIKTNVMGTINMLGLCKRVGARFLLASTSEVYGDPHEHPQRETYWGNVNPIGPRSCYDEGKRVAETLTESYRLQNHVDTRIVRIFNTYGPRMLFDDGRVVSNFIVQALKGNDITVYGDGNQTRSFCYVSDLVAGLIAMMQNESFHGPVNLGNPNEMTIAELAKLIISMTNSKSKLRHENLPKDDPVRRKPDITVAGRELNWKPTVELKQGLTKTIADFEQRLRAEG
ncbi:MAG: SDR family oxidoreductase [Deltaproteobacteria bacterium]|nr:SDR family oxidoreductase [Deltaproteobacteria bacterium]